MAVVPEGVAQEDAGQAGVAQAAPPPPAKQPPGDVHNTVHRRSLTTKEKDPRTLSLLR